MGLIHYAGSGRNFANSPIENLKDLLQNTYCADYVEGHQSAFGISIPDYKFDTFLGLTDTILANIDFSPKYLVDFIFNAQKEYESIILDLASNEELWGQAIAEPVIAIENINVTKDNLTLMSKDKNPTLKITLSNGVSLIKFKSSQAEFEKLYSETGFVKINVVGTCALNEWMGNVSAQVLVTEYEVVGQQQFYF